MKVPESREGREQRIAVFRRLMWLFIWTIWGLTALLGMAVSFGYSVFPYVVALLPVAPLLVLCAVQTARIRGRMERDGQQ